MSHIQITATDDEILGTHSIMKQLHENLRKESQTAYLEHVKTLKADFGFNLATLTEEEQVICVAGFRVCRNLGWGKYLYLDDLVTDKRRRSNGAGRKMLEWLIEHARSERCIEVRLDAKVTRHAAHRFYFRERMDIAAFHFHLSL
ncbi:MAG: GNAT family N-acetyltransferase [Methylocella sp.]